MIGLEYILLIGSILILLSIAIAKLSDNLGVPTLLLFLVVGMLAGSEGPGGIEFDNVGLAQSIGIIALILILFAGGLDTNWSSVRPVLWQAVGLSTLGVLLTSVCVGLFAVYVLEFPLVIGLLLGAIISSTDAAAVFSVLRSKNVSLHGNLRPLLELESGSNDPMAVFLTIGLVSLAVNPELSVTSLLVLFVVQMGVGLVAGFGLGKLAVVVLNRLRLAYEGIYPVFVLASVGLVYGLTSVVGGSGFLAVYVCGLVMGKSDIVQKRWMLRFFDGLAWLSQIAMFLTLGLLVYPSDLLTVLGAGLLVSFFLMFVARPVSVFLTTFWAKSSRNEKLLVSWVGLRGAVPIILATFPLLAGLPLAPTIFNLVFFIVLTSALLQGWSIPSVAKWLGVDAPWSKRRRYPLEFDRAEGTDTDLVELVVPFSGAIAGKAVVDLHLPADSLIVLVSRNEEFIVPSGETILEGGDTLLVLVNETNLPEVREILSAVKKKEQT
jgi:cell volume regulation protein A